MPTSPSGRSWIESANHADCDFPLANLPFCAIAAAVDETHLGIGIGDCIFDLAAAASTSFIPNHLREACTAPSLNALMQLGPEASSQLRAGLTALFADTASAPNIADARTLLRPIAGTTFRLPVAIGNYTDFYASIHHATRVGKLFRPDQPLLPNYKYIPIGYHGRASSIRVSGAPVHRPSGQLKLPENPAPVFAPCRQLDFELEMGAYVGTGNPLGTPIDIADADRHLFGLSLLNDWSARDIQAWEAQPLGPFLSKSFLTTVSPWVVSMEALAPFRRTHPARPPGDPEPLAYLASTAASAFDIHVEALLSTQAMRDLQHAPLLLAAANTQDLYWTFAQMLTHHASNGCNLLPGDLLGSGTLSGPDSKACMLELTLRGAVPVQLPSGESRAFLEGGDEIILRAFCQQPGGPRIGFGECRGRIQT